MCARSRGDGPLVERLVGAAQHRLQQLDADAWPLRAEALQRVQEQPSREHDVDRPSYGRPVPGGDFLGYDDPDGAGFTFSGDYAFNDQGKIDTKGINARLARVLANDMTFISVTNDKDNEKRTFLDVNAAPVNQLINCQGADASTFTQEFRLNAKSERSRAEGPGQRPARAVRVWPDRARRGYRRRCGHGDGLLLAVQPVRVRSRRAMDADHRPARHPGEKDFSMDQPHFLSTGTDQLNNGMFLFSAHAEPFAVSTSDDLWAGTIGFDLATLCGCNRSPTASRAGPASAHDTTSDTLRPRGARPRGRRSLPIPDSFREGVNVVTGGAGESHQRNPGA